MSPRTGRRRPCDPANHLDRLLDQKQEAQYDHRYLRAATAHRALRNAERLVAAAERHLTD